jgi:hypothetical protein
MRRKDPLASLRVIVPWSSMEGDDAVRFCGSCRILGKMAPVAPKKKTRR